MKDKNKNKNKSKKYNENDKVNASTDMETGNIGAKNDAEDFVPNLQKWTTSDEQKSKAREIQKKTER